VCVRMVRVALVALPVATTVTMFFALIHRSSGLLHTQPTLSLLRASRAASRTTRTASALFSTDTDTSVSASTSASVPVPRVDRTKVKKLLEADASIIGQTVFVQGWVRTVRDQKNFAFVEINDGSSLAGIQAVADSSIASYSQVSIPVYSVY
jgi:hypothetical protein